MRYAIARPLSCDRLHYDIRLFAMGDRDIQPRVKLDPTTVAEYAEDMKRGATFPAIVAFKDGTTYWVAEGYHRVESALSVGATEMVVEVRVGTKRDAILYAAGSNATHGLRRSNEDKRMAIEMLLQDPEWCAWSDREIARRCQVHHQLVAKVRSSTEDRPVRTARTYTTKHGTTATMNAKSKMAQSQIGTRVAILSTHALLAGKSGTISQVPNTGAAIVELDDGSRELINIEHLKAEIAPHLKLDRGGLVEIRNSRNPDIEARLGRIAYIGNETVEVWVRNVDRMTMHKHRLAISQLEPLPIESEPNLKAISVRVASPQGNRLARLVEVGLDPFDLEIISMLERAVVRTPRELEHLERMEERYLEEESI